MAKKEPTPEQVEAEIEAILVELHLLGFAAAKQIAVWRKQSFGTMSCPLCKQQLRFSIAAGNGHFAAKCSTENCIHMME